MDLKKFKLESNQAKFHQCFKINIKIIFLNWGCIQHRYSLGQKNCDKLDKERKKNTFSTDAESNLMT